ncbi:MAG: ABC transporter permease [Acidobacteria bacterium]|nr:ABC transporter permease [Acidobacteriota bacterium]
MSRLEETHGTKFELVRHFLARMFDSEMFSTRGQGWTVGVSALALALPAGMLLLDPPYFHRPIAQDPDTLRAVAIAGQLAMLTFVYSVTGILALLAWQSLFPSRRDYLALAGLPVRSRQIFAARFASVLLLAGGITLAMSLLPTVMAPHQFTARWEAGPPPLTQAAARAASSTLGCLFVFFAIVAVQGILINTLPARWFARLSSWVQGALVAVCFLAGLYSWFIVDWRQEAIARLPDFAAWAPPVWFLGLHQAILGDGDPFFGAMAARALGAAAGAVAVAALLYVLAYSRYRKLLLESPDTIPQRRMWQWSPLRLLARNPRQEAILQFMAMVLSRSRPHRLVWMAYLAAGLALMINSVLLAGVARGWSGGWRDLLRFVVLYWPVGLSFIVLAGVRHAFLMPAEWPANWLFRIAESHGRREWMSAVERFVMACVVAPLHLIPLPIAAAVLGWPVAARMTALQVLASLSAFEILFYSWQQLPFACSYVPGKRPMAALAGSWIAVLTIVAPLLSRIVAAMSQLLEVFLFFLAIFGALWLWLRRLRREGWGEARLIYEDRHGAVTDLGIKDLTYRGGGFQVQTPAAPEPAPNPTGGPVAISLRLYRSLARAFPQEFRNAYGGELVQATEDSIDSIWRRYGRFGLARLLTDIAFRIPAEHLAELGQDVRYGLRMLAGSPGFTAVALVSISLGICAGTSAFSFMNGTILRNVPGVRKPAELVALRAPASYPHYKRYRERSDLFSSTLAYAPVPFAVSFDGRTERTWGHLVTPSYFSTLGVRPALGRAFDDEEERPGRELNAVASYRYWQDHLGSDPSVIGKILRINGRPCTLIGVGPKEFMGASPLIFAADLWLPLSDDARVAPELAGNALERRSAAIFQVVGRLRPGVTVARAEAALDTIARQLEQEDGDPYRNQKGRRVSLVTGGRMVPFRSANLPMLVASPIVLVGLMLLIACSNVANMMLARAAVRRREIAVRLALGASRFRLIRQLLTESMLVAAGAGVLGLLLTAWLMRLVSQPDVLRFAVRAPYPAPVNSSMAPDGRVLLFTLGLAVFTGLAFGLAPALQAVRTDLSPALKDGGGVWLRRYGRLSLRNLLVVSQVAASLTLLLLTGILALGYARTTGIEVGFDPRNLYLVSVDPVRDGYSGAQAAAFLQNLLEHVKRMPSVTAASLTDTAPMRTLPPPVTFSTAGAIGSADKFVVGKDYFDTVGIPILLGRGLRREDEAGEAAPVIVSERLMRDFWKGENPLGRRIEIGRGMFQVVGVARNTKMYFTPEEARPAIYFPLRAENYARPSFTGVCLLVRSAPGVDAVALVRREILSLASDVTPLSAFSMPELIGRMMFVRDRHPHGAGRSAQRRARAGDEGRRSPGDGRHAAWAGRRLGRHTPVVRAHRHAGPKHPRHRLRPGAAGGGPVVVGGPGFGGLLPARP